MNPRVNIRPIPAKTYAGQPRTPLTFSLVLAMTSASTPMPVMTRKTSSSSRRGSSALGGSSPLSGSDDSESGNSRTRPDVDPPVLAGEDDHQGVLELLDGQLEVAGEQVAGTAREQAHRGVGADQRGRHGADRPVATEGQTMSTPRSSASLA